MVFSTIKNDNMVEKLPIFQSAQFRDTTLDFNGDTGIIGYLSIERQKDKLFNLG